MLLHVGLNLLRHAHTKPEIVISMKRTLGQKMNEKHTVRRKEKFIWFLSTFYYWSFLIIPSSAEFKGMTRKHTVNKKLDWFNLIDLFFGISKSKYRNQWMVILSFSHAKINYQFFWRRFTSILYLKNNDQPDWQHQKLLFHYYNVRQK